MGAVHIDASEVKGEPYTGYEAPADKGPFECGNCRYFSGGCGQKTMKDKSRLPRNNKGLVIVDEHGCCENVDRRGKLYSR